MNWTKDTKKEFRELLISIYRSIGDLEILVADSTGEILANIAQISTLKKCALDIIQSLECSGELDDFFNYFFEENKENKSYVERIKILQSELDELVPQKKKNAKISSQDWKSLFDIFNEDEFPAIVQSCKAAFKDCFKRELKEIYPDCPNLDSLPRVREVLEKYDDPELAVAFANRAIGLIAKLEGDARDTSAIADWGEQIARIHAVDLKIGVPVKSQQIDAYLLVALRRQGGGIHLLAELHRTDDRLPEPIDIDPNNRGISCKFPDDGDVEISQVIAEPLSQLIEKAELRSDREIASFTLEVFLPLEYLDLRVYEWDIIDDFNDLTKLGEYCAFIVRSLDRAMNPRWLHKFERSWMNWQQNLNRNQTINCYCIDVRDSTCDRLSSGNLLIDKIGVKLAAGLPENRDRRSSVLQMLVKSFVPIAFWVDQVECSGDTIQQVIQQNIQDFNKLLTVSSLNDFSTLATEIKKQRVPNNPIYHLGMLCDCPERMLTLPSSSNIPRARIS